MLPPTWDYVVGAEGLEAPDTFLARGPSGSNK